MRLSDEDRDALTWLMRHLRATQLNGIPPRGDKAKAMGVIERLLAGRGES